MPAIPALMPHKNLQPIWAMSCLAKHPHVRFLLYANCEPATSHIYTHNPKVPAGSSIPSSSGNSYMLILYNFNSKSLHTKPCYVTKNVPWYTHYCLIKPLGSLCQNCKGLGEGHFSSLTTRLYCNIVIIIAFSILKFKSFIHRPNKLNSLDRPTKDIYFQFPSCNCFPWFWCIGTISAHSMIFYLNKLFLMRTLTDTFHSFSNLDVVEGQTWYSIYAWQEARLLFSPSFSDECRQWWNVAVEAIQSKCSHIFCAHRDIDVW